MKESFKQTLKIINFLAFVCLCMFAQWNNERFFTQKFLFDVRIFLLKTNGCKQHFN